MFCRVNIVDLKCPSFASAKPTMSIVSCGYAPSLDSKDTPQHFSGGDTLFYRLR